MVGAAVRKPRVPNDQLHLVTDNRLAEAHSKVLHGVCRWSRLARYGGLPVLRALKVIGNFKLDASVDEHPVKFLQNGGARFVDSIMARLQFSGALAISAVFPWLYFCLSSTHCVPLSLIQVNDDVDEVVSLLMQLEQMRRQRLSNRMPPVDYLCHLCFQKGHFIKDCPQVWRH